MDSDKLQPTAVCHVVAMPFPGRGHVNPMMNFCKLLVSRKNDILITFVVTEEWLGYIGSDPKPDNISFRSLSNNGTPLERVRAADFSRFYEAVMKNLEAPFEQLLDRLEPPITAIIGDIEVLSTIGVGNRRGIPVASFWTMSASIFSVFYHFDIFTKNQHSPFDLLENEDHVPGISSSDVAELRKVFLRNDKRVLQLALECISMVPKAQYLLFTSVYEIEPLAIDILKAIFTFPVYTIGPAIPYLELDKNLCATDCLYDHDYLQWLDSKSIDSVLYISLGSFLSVSSTQMDEIVSGLQNSGVRYLWVARGEADRLNKFSGDTGLVVPWCDQLKVLCHSSVGGFWTHCGWNSTLEAVYAGVPMLTFPLFLDQGPNSKQIVECWKIGRRVSAELGPENLVTRKQIAEQVRRFMDLESNEGKEMRRRARELHNVCRQGIAEDGSSTTNLDAFIRGISPGHGG